jgi:lysophospholipase L1-like esterase
MQRNAMNHDHGQDLRPSHPAGYLLAALALAPLLLVQGFWVRLRTRDGLALLDELGPEAFDVALCSFGVNDVTAGTRTRAFASGLRDLVERLKERFGVRLVLLTVLPPMHAFPALPQPLRHVLGHRALGA